MLVHLDEAHVTEDDRVQLDWVATPALERDLAFVDAAKITACSFRLIGSR